mgnify:CR=1 FL=1
MKLIARLTIALGFTLVGFRDQTPTVAVSPSLPIAPSNFTSVDELSDVQPTDWAYEALQSLIDRYEIDLGYPDGMFRGDRAMTRYEFAAALNEVAKTIEQLQASEQEVAREDLATLARLQRTYASALESLRVRLDTRVEPTLTALEDQQFSPTTKLRGQWILGITDGNRAAPTFVSRTRLNLRASWQPNQVLVTQLEMGNDGLDAIGKAQLEPPENLLGTTGLLAGGGGLDFAQVEPQVRLNRLYYTFRPHRPLSVTVGAKMAPSDLIDRNAFANDSAADFSSSFFVNNPLIVQNRIDRPGGAGAAIAWNFSKIPLTISGLYVSKDGGQDLFGDRYQASLELAYSPSDRATVRLQYTNADIDDIGLDAFGINFDWGSDRAFGLFGRAGVGRYNGGGIAGTPTGSFDAWTWAIGISLRDRLIPGTLAGVAIGQPFVADAVGDATQTNFELFYSLPLSDNIGVTLASAIVANADNNSDRPTIWQGTLRTAISF